MLIWFHATAVASKRTIFGTVGLSLPPFPPLPLGDGAGAVPSVHTCVEAPAVELSSYVQSTEMSYNVPGVRPMKVSLLASKIASPGLAVTGGAAFSCVEDAQLKVI